MNIGPRHLIQRMSEGFRRLREHVLVITEHGILVTNLLEEIAVALDANYE